MTYSKLGLTLCALKSRPRCYYYLCGLKLLPSFLTLQSKTISPILGAVKKKTVQGKRIGYLFLLFMPESVIYIWAACVSTHNTLLDAVLDYCCKFCRRTQFFSCPFLFCGHCKQRCPCYFGRGACHYNEASYPAFLHSPNMQVGPAS